MFRGSYFSLCLLPGNHAVIKSAWKPSDLLKFLLSPKCKQRVESTGARMHVNDLHGVKKCFSAGVCQCEEQISRSLAVAQALADDVDFHVLSFRDFGKGQIKKCKVSPDAFIQMTLQLAYYRVRCPLKHGVGPFFYSLPTF